MTRTWRITFLAVCYLVGSEFCNGALPSPEAVGRLLGYPPSELVIEDNTSQERITIQTPSRRDQKKKAVLPDSSVLLRAYIIRGKNERSFFPIQVYIGKKGAFLTPEVVDLLAKEDAAPINRRVAGTGGFTTIGRGGWYFTQYFKIKSAVPPASTASMVVANVIVVQPQGQEVDVQVAQILNLDLQPIPGGEAYFRTFGPADPGTAAPQLSGSKLYAELSKLVIAEWLNEKTTNGVGSAVVGQSDSRR